MREIIRHANTVVIGLARGGMPVAFQVAKALGSPLDVLVVRKLGVPGHEELGFGAIAPGGVRVLTDEIIRECHISSEAITAVEKREASELARRECLYRRERQPLRVADREVVLVDDGLATGASMMAAVRWAKAQRAGRILVAVPVGAADTCERLRGEGAVECHCSFIPKAFGAVGLWYEDFTQVSDEEVRGFLEERQEEVAREGAGESP